jgi:excisionase family DNA binding protein
LNTKASWPNCLAGLEGAFGMETNNSPNPFFLKTHLTVQIASEVSGYNPQYIRRLLRDGKLEGDKIGQIWLIRKESFEEYLTLEKGVSDRRFGPKKANEIHC